MKVVVACYGTRGDVEPCAAVAKELARRGYDVRIAVPPDLVGFVEKVGLQTVGFGPSLNSFVESVHNTWVDRKRLRGQLKLWRENRSRHALCWNEMGTTVMSLAEGADLLVTGLYLEESASNVAEYLNIPVATLHHSPVRPNSRVAPTMPAWLIRSAMILQDWQIYLSMSKTVDDAQRHALGLPKAVGPSSRRMAQRGSLEIQAYDAVCFPGLSEEWKNLHSRRPFVGGLTMELPTQADALVSSWIGAGPPPICFAFGSTPVKSPAAAIEMINSVCAILGERALVCASWGEFNAVSDSVKVVSSVNYAAVFPICRAVVHHGGAGTTTASLRAGVPTLILSTFPDQALWGAQVKRLQVGTTQPFASTTAESLIVGLRHILAPDYVTRAQQFGARMTKSVESVARTAQLLETFAQSA